MTEENQTIPPEIASLSFEQALEELDAAVRKMDSQAMPLEELIAVFERGSKLSAHCREKLSGYEKRIEILTQQGKFQEFSPGEHR